MINQERGKFSTGKAAVEKDPVVIITKMR